MSSAQKIIETIKNIFGDVDLPVSVSVIDKEDGLALYETKTCKAHDDKLEAETTNIFGLMAYEDLTKALKTRSNTKVDMLIFRSEAHEYCIVPVADNIFMCATTDAGQLGKLMTFMDGIARQISYRLDQLGKER